MSGIYFHIPFCKQACHYCDFHFVTSLRYKKDLLEAMKSELEIRQEEFLSLGSPLQSIYFGGGTPSLLEAGEVADLLAWCDRLFGCSLVQEITLEANPDDLSAIKIQGLKEAGVNRLSIGVQSFFDEDLRWMNRAHQGEEAKLAIRRAQDAGLVNITADLIYGYPLLTDEKWMHNIRSMVELGVPHVSAYSMTVEPRTALGTWVRRGQEPPMDDDQSARQFEILMGHLAMSGYEHYEISNWAKAAYEAVHNTHYWKGKPYLGIGPSAHSFDGQKRSWNRANNAQYIASIQSGELPSEYEVLREEDRFNEYVMLSLRTKWGLDLSHTQATFQAAMHTHLLRELQPFVGNESLTIKEDRVVLTSKGKLIADHIAASLFY